MCGKRVGLQCLHKMMWFAVRCNSLTCLQVEVSHSPIQDADMYMRRLDLRAQPEAAAYCGVGPPLPLQADAETQVHFTGHVYKPAQYCWWPPGMLHTSSLLCR